MKRRPKKIGKKKNIQQMKKIGTVTIVDFSPKNQDSEVDPRQDL